MRTDNLKINLVQLTLSMPKDVDRACPVIFGITKQHRLVSVQSS